ncbi:MAG TPA: FHA domain-containing protein [Pirellulales bacterium]|jgi:predicted component of type VI protein secretion system|nr:FHA domain-containing protein [Pirellulales bacterium]
MQAKLVVVEPDIQPGEYDVTLPLTIGRGREAKLKLVHALVSRQHCELFFDHGHLMVRDLGSLNGTFVGGRRIETAPLLSGELLTIGSVILRVHYGEQLEALPGAAASFCDGQVMVAAVDTISLEDTSQAARLIDDDDDFGDSFDAGDGGGTGLFDPRND